METTFKQNWIFKSAVKIHFKEFKKINVVEP